MGIETALVGLGMSASTAATVSSAAGILSGISSGLSVVSGIQGMSEGRQQAKNAYADATANIQEQTRQSVRQADQERKSAETARRQQKLAYMASGVSLEGSPLLMLEETRQRGISNAAEVMASGSAYGKAAATSVKQNAKGLVSAGRKGFITGVTGALSNYANFTK